MKAIALCLTLMFTGLSQAACLDWLDTQKRKLHSQDEVDLCELTEDKPVLLVNTASHCGFTPQFQQLEGLHRNYGYKGLVIIGFPSDDFFQEADDEAESADICYLNYGVSFTMTSPIHVRGEKADPIFVELAEQGAAPKWNFYKYLVDKKGKLVGYWSPRTKPDDPEITQAIERLLN